MLTRFMLMAALVTCLTAATANAQVDTSGLGDLQSLLEEAGLGDLTGTDTGGTSITPTDLGFEEPQTPGDGTGQPGSGGRTPIISNNFTAHRGGTLAERAPGRQIQTAIAINTGAEFPFTNTEPVEDVGFFRFAFEEIIRTIINGINENITGNLLGGNLLSGLGGLSGLGNLDSLFNDPADTPNQQTAVTPIQNGTTTGQGTVTPVE